MSQLAELLRKSVRASSRSNRVALLVSSGMDSLSVASALQAEGKEISLYTLEIKGWPSMERARVEWLARHFGWKLTVILVPVTGLRNDFLELAVVNHCRKKVQFEVLWPLLYVFPHIRETEVWTGWNADDHYGNTKKPRLIQSGLVKDGLSQVERKCHFDEWRRELRHQFFLPDSPDTWWYAKQLALQHGKDLIDPYLDDEIFEYFLQFDHDQLSPFSKPVIREAFAEYLKGVPDGKIGAGIRLQKGARVDALFEKLLSDATINRWHNRSVSALCQRWGKEIAADPGLVDITKLPSRAVATARVSTNTAFAAYTLADVEKESAQKRFTYISMFAGGGGSSIGYRLEGGIGPLVNEFVPAAVRTYLKNFPGTFVDTRDIREIVRHGAERFLAQVGLKLGDIDIVDGSPPCSEFSQAGKGIGDQDRLRPYSDVQQSGIALLPFDFIEFAVNLQPKVIVCENVPSLAGTYSDVLDNLLHALRWSDRLRSYYANAAVLSAADFGVPQNRKRLFIIGVRHDVAEAVGIQSDEAVLELFPSSTSAPLSVRDAFEGLVQTWEDFSPWRQSAARPPLHSLIRRLPKNPPKPTRLSHFSPGETSNFTLTRCSWDEPAPTLTVTAQKPNGLAGAIHPSHDRKFTVPELKRLFGLPDDYQPTGTLSQAAERICRMVPPFLTRAIAESVYKNILRPYREKSDV